MRTYNKCHDPERLSYLFEIGVDPYTSEHYPPARVCGPQPWWYCDGIIEAQIGRMDAFWEIVPAEDIREYVRVKRPIGMGVA